MSQCKGRATMVCPGRSCRSLTAIRPTVERRQVGHASPVPRFLFLPLLARTIPCRTTTRKRLMSTQETEWHIVCDTETFEKCQRDQKFAYIVTLARAVNALNFVNSAMVDTKGRDD